MHMNDSRLCLHILFLYMVDCLMDKNMVNIVTLIAAHPFASEQLYCVV